MAYSGHPIDAVEWVDRNELFANDYNPNKVARPELELLELSIVEDGWTQPIVALESGEIVDGFHRWTISARPRVFALTGGLVPVVRLRPADKASQRMSTIRHNRARGQHIVLKMADIVRDLLAEGVSEQDIMKRLGMEDEEVDRLADRAGMPARAGMESFNKGWEPSNAGG